MSYNPYLLRDNKFRGQSIETYVQGGERYVQSIVNISNLFFSIYPDTSISRDLSFQFFRLFLQKCKYL